MEGLPHHRAAGLGAPGQRRPHRAGRRSAARARSLALTPGSRDSRRIVLWRHGRTAWNLEDRFQGHSDVPLDKTGRVQARRAAPLLASLRPSRIISSDLCRAADTAAALAKLVDQPVRLDARLRESYGAECEGLTDAEIQTRYGPAYEDWERGGDIPAAGAETRRRVAERVSAAVLDGLAEVPAGGTLIVATHGGAARVAVARLVGLPRELWTTLAVLSNCCWSVLAEEDYAPSGFRLIEHNAGALPEPFLGVED